MRRLRSIRVVELHAPLLAADHDRVRVEPRLLRADGGARRAAHTEGSAGVVVHHFRTRRLGFGELQTLHVIVVVEQVQLQLALQLSSTRAARVVVLAGRALVAPARLERAPRDRLVVLRLKVVADLVRLLSPSRSVPVLDLLLLLLLDQLLDDDVMSQNFVLRHHMAQCLVVVVAVCGLVKHPVQLVRWVVVVSLMRVYLRKQPLRGVIITVLRAPRALRPCLRVS